MKILLLHNFYGFVAPSGENQVFEAERTLLQTYGIKIKPITPEQTINELADAILKLANDSELRAKMGAAGKKRIEEYYTWDKKGEFIKKLYEEVLGRTI